MLSAEEWRILATSLGVAGRAVAFSLPVAIAFAYALSRPRFPGKAVVDAIAHLPLVLPPVLVGFLLLLAFGRRGPIGGWLESAFGIQLAFTAEGAALATAIMAFPLMVRAIRLSFEATDRGVFEAAAVLRAGGGEDAAGTLQHVKAEGGTIAPGFGDAPQSASFAVIEERYRHEQDFMDAVADGATDRALAALQGLDLTLVPPSAVTHVDERPAVLLENGIVRDVNRIGHLFENDLDVGQQPGPQQDIQLVFGINGGRELRVLHVLLGEPARGSAAHRSAATHSRSLAHASALTFTTAV